VLNEPYGTALKVGPHATGAKREALSSSAAFSFIAVDPAICPRQLETLAGAATRRPAVREGRGVKIRWARGRRWRGR
jgi:hypothetical protein